MVRAVGMQTGGAALQGRIVWIDMVRGIVICLVVMLHAIFALLTWFPAVDGAGPMVSVIKLTLVLDHVRMPALFFCAGLVFAFSIGRGWDWFLRHRLRVFLWIIVVWTLLAAAVEALGLHLNPDGPSPMVPLRQLFLVPYGNLWFVYALMIVSTLAMLLRPLPMVDRHLVVVALYVPASLIWRHYALPAGADDLVQGLVYDALVFFMLGLWWGPAIMRLFDNRRIALAVEVMLFGFGMLLLSRIAPENPLFPLMVRLPLTGGFLAMIRILASWEPVARLFEMIGRASLEIFLLNQFLLAGLYVVLQGFAPGIGPVAVLLLLWCLPLAGSLLIARILLRWSGCPLFRAPDWLVWHDRQQRADLAAWR